MPVSSLLDFANPEIGKIIYRTRHKSPSALTRDGKTLRKQTTLVRVPVTALFLGYAVAQLVEALRYKLEGLGFDSR